MRHKITFKQQIFFWLFALSSATKALDIKKLELHEATFINTLEQPITIIIRTLQKCAQCKDRTIIKNFLMLQPAEKKVLKYDSLVIDDIELLDLKVSFFIDRKIQQKNKSIDHTFYFLEKKNHLLTELQFSEFDFDLLMDVTPSNKGSNRKSNYFYKKYLTKEYPSFLTHLLPTQANIPQVFDDFKKLYAKNSLSNLMPAVLPKIPFIIHQIWFGITGDKPHLYKKWEKGIKKLHPDWRFICWNKEMIEMHFIEKLYNQDLFDEACKNNTYVTMADVARYEVVNKFGGFYIDSDSEPFESFAPLHLRYDFFTSLEPVISWPFGCGVNAFGARANHPILTACLSLVKERKNLSYEMTQKIRELAECYKNYAQKSQSFFKVLYSTGPLLFLAGVLKGIDKDSNVDIVFPNVYCCQSFKPMLESFSCHHFFLPAIKQSKPYHWSNKAKREEQRR